MTDVIRSGAPGDAPRVLPSDRLAVPAMLTDAAVGDAAAEVAAARDALHEELATLGASAKAAVDIKAKVRRSPGKAAAAVGGAAFVAVGGPRRTFRALKRRIAGEPEPLPPSLLPEEVEKSVRALGEDGAKVRGALERGFAGWLDATAKDRKAEARQRSLVNLAMKIGLPIASKAAQQAVSRAMREGVGRGEREAARDAGDPDSPAGARRRPRRGTGSARLAPRASGGMADAPALGAGAA